MTRTRKESQKRAESSKDKEFAMKRAVEEYDASRGTPGAMPVYQLAKKYEVPISTLYDRLKGSRSLSSFNASKSHLNAAESAKIIEHIIELAERGFPPTVSRVTKMVNDFLHARHHGIVTGYDHSRGGWQTETTAYHGSPTQVGKQWTRRWMDRHADKLTLYWTTSLDTVRANALNPANKDAWFQLLKSELDKYNIAPECLFVADESSMVFGTSQKSRVVGKVGKRNQYAQRKVNRETATILATISADGKWHCPYIVFKGKKVQAKWTEKNPLGAAVAVGPKGYMNDELGVVWLKDVFDPATRDIAAGRVRMLLLDGHHSHHSEDFLKLARSLNIVCLGYPPHTTHALQALDVAGFSQLKHYWNVDLINLWYEGASRVTKDTFLELLDGPFRKALTPETISMGFRKTGVHPFNPDAITAEQLAPSKANSRDPKYLFPLPQPSPVRAVIAAFEFHLKPSNALSFESTSPSTSPTQPTTTGDDPFASQEINTAMAAMTLNDTGNNSNITPDQQMAQAATSLLRGTSAAFLVTDEPESLHGEAKVHPPIISHPVPFSTSVNQRAFDRLAPRLTRSDLLASLHLLQDELFQAKATISQQVDIIQSSNAQLVLQHWYATHNHLGAYAPVQKTRKTFFPGGKPRVLTGDEFMEDVSNAVAEKKAQDAERAARKVARAERADSKKAEDEAYKKLKAKWKEDKEKWEKKVKILREQGVMVKNLPKAPRMPLRKEITTALEQADDDSEEEIDLEDVETESEEGSWEGSED